MGRRQSEATLPLPLGPPSPCCRWRLSSHKPHSFITVGLFRWARYPNYFGEMLCWWGMWLLCSASFHGGAWASVVSPLFVCVLLLFVSGIPLQERQAQLRWGDDPAYQEHVRRTRLLVPLPQLPC